jgi:hypothetical protein
MIWRKADPAAGATYPTGAEREKVQGILDPLPASGPPVDDPAGFRTDMAARLEPSIRGLLDGALELDKHGHAALDFPEFLGLSDVAQAEVTKFYGPYLTAAVHSPAKQSAYADYHFRKHVHDVPSIETRKAAGKTWDWTETDKTAKDLIASLMRLDGADVLAAHHVLTGKGHRDQRLFEEVRDSIFKAQPDVFRVIILNHPGWESPAGEVFVQRRVLEEPRKTPAESDRLARWDIMYTLLHEMLHAVAHEDFRSAAEHLEKSGIALEGFADYFTRPVYDHLAKQAASDAALRRSVEGAAAPYVQPPAPNGK